MLFLFLVEASSSCYSVTLTVRKKTNCKEFDFYYKTDDSLRKSVSCSNSETVVQFLSLRSSRWHSFWVSKGKKTTALLKKTNEYYHTVVSATKKLSNSEAKPRCYDNFEGDNNRVVIFLINTCCDHIKIEHILIGFSFLFFVDNFIFKSK